jgi:hypothetical protein
VSFAIEPSPEVWHRNDLPILADWRRLRTMVEVGVDRAEFAHHFLSRSQIRHYWGVDDYRQFKEANFDRHPDYLMAVMRLEQFGDRARLVRLNSVEAARVFDPGSVDFIYVDGSHDQKSVAADLRAWWPRLSDQGICAGHDFDDTHPGVKQAVTAFAQEHDLTVYLTAVEGFGQESCPSWYCYRSGLPGPEWRRC